MAKKKSKIPRSTIILGSILGVVSLVLLFTIFPNILQQEIITVQTIEDQVQDGIDSGLLEIPFACANVLECADQGIIIGDIMNSTLIEEIIDPAPIDDINPVEQCIPPSLFLDGICSEPFIPIIEVPPTLSLVSNTIKIDNTGTRFESTTNTDIPLLSFFVEDTTNLDFDQGFIEQTLSLKTDPNSMITGSGTFNVLIANETIFTVPTPISFSGISDANGELQIDFVSPSGFKSKLFTFKFADFVTNFNSTGLTTMRFVVQDLVVQVNGFSFGLASNDILTFDIARDPNRIIITDEQGGTIRVFPTDDALNFSSTNGRYSYKTCSVRSVRFGCQTYRSISVTLGAIPVGSMQLFQVINGNDVLLETSTSGTGNLLSVFIQRNEVYKLLFSNPAGSISFKTPEEQMNYSFNCRPVFNTSTGARDLVCNYLNPVVIQSFADTLP